MVGIQTLIPLGPLGIQEAISLEYQSLEKGTRGRDDVVTYSTARKARFCGQHHLCQEETLLSLLESLDCLLRDHLLNPSGLNIFQKDFGFEQ